MTIWNTKLDDHKVDIVSQDFTHLTQDFSDTPSPNRRDVIGIGFETERDGTYLRAAVEMRKEHSVQELHEAVHLLFKAFLDPEAKDVKVVRAHVELTPNVMQTSALKEQIELQKK